MNAAPPLIELEGIGRRYKGKRGAPVIALRDVSLRLHAGEFVCITGPSGSGKTTLMNVLGCLDQPDAGVYRFLGREVQRLGLGRPGLAAPQGFRVRISELQPAGLRYGAARTRRCRRTYAGLGASSRAAARARKLLNGLGLAKAHGDIGRRRFPAVNSSAFRLRER